MFYSPRCWLTSHFPPFRCQSFQPLYLHFHFALFLFKQQLREAILDHQSWIGNNSYVVAISNGGKTTLNSQMHHCSLEKEEQILENVNTISCTQPIQEWFSNFLTENAFYGRKEFSLRQQTTEFKAGLISVCAAQKWVPSRCHSAASPGTLLPKPLRS